MRALDDVVHRFGALRVAGEAALLAQGAEVLAPGEELVHVALVAGVEHDRVVRRMERAVDRERQLDDAEIRSEVTAGLRDLADQEPADLGRQFRQLLAAEPIEVARTVDPLEQGHGIRLRVAAGYTRLRSTYCRIPPFR